MVLISQSFKIFCWISIVLELVTIGHKRELIWFEEPNMDRQWIRNCNRRTEEYSDGVMEWSTPLSLELALRFV
ncbi:hypothetical protein GBA52_025131 [Prunus armeniaca]|nr:hypothetical protein GBA52_025131 [Prunus armeniaca]